MKKKTKGILAFAFLGGIMVTSGVTIALPGIDPPGTEPQDLENLTPAEYFTEEQRPQFCGSSIARSTAYVQEFSIPTVCTNPLGITTDYDGNVWFGQTNTGRVAMFDPVTEEFAEYDNPTWPLGTRSMMWGMAYAPDGHVWYTDDTYDSLWRFSPATGEYERLQFPSDGDSLPQKLEIDGSQIIVNDFTGNKLTFFSSSPNTSEISYLNIPSPFNGSQAADFAVDPDNNVWFTTWSLPVGRNTGKVRSGQVPRIHLKPAQRGISTIQLYGDLWISSKHAHPQRGGDYPGRHTVACRHHVVIILQL